MAIENCVQVLEIPIASFYIYRLMKNSIKYFFLAKRLPYMLDYSKPHNIMQNLVYNTSSMNSSSYYFQNTIH